MNKTRLFFAAVLFLAVAALAGSQVAWADSANAANSQAVLMDGQPSLPQAGAPQGSVVPPPTTRRICSPEDVPGVYSIGGVASLFVDELAPGYCVQANLIGFGQQKLDRLPAGGKDFMTNVVLLRIYYKGLVDEVSPQDGDMSLCFALPPDKDVEIYFYDFFGARFFNRAEEPSWVSKGTLNEDNMVCAPAMASGAYVLVEK